MRIATWNVNSIKQRVDHLRRLDVGDVCPTLCACRRRSAWMTPFPREPFEAIGYNVAVHGQKTFNGVAVLSKFPFDEVTPRLPGNDSDDHARFIEAVISTEAGVLSRCVDCICPMAIRPTATSLPYKIAWMDRLMRYASERLQLEERLVLAGDFNVIPMPADARHPDRWVKDALFQPLTRAKFRTLCNLGLTDAVRAATDGLWSLHLLGLSSRRLAEERWNSHRPPAAFSAGFGSPYRDGRGQACAKLGKAVRPRPGVDRPCTGRRHLSG